MLFIRFLFLFVLAITMLNVNKKNSALFKMIMNKKLGAIYHRIDKLPIEIVMAARI